MKIKLSKVLFPLAAVLLAGQLNAQTIEEKQAMYVDNFYADCGIGGAIFKNDTGGIISNLIWDWGLTATTSFMSSPETCEGKEVQAANLIRETFDSFAQDVARGEGENLSVALQIYGCVGDQADQAVTHLRSNMASAISGEAFLAAEEDVKATRVFRVVNEAMSTCSA